MPFDDNFNFLWFWTLVKGDKYEAVTSDDSYRVYMRLKIRNVSPIDFGTYKCVAKNSLGETDGIIKLYGTSPPTSTSLQIHT